MPAATTDRLLIKPIDVLLGVCPAPRLILDIGAGSGFFCQVFRAHYPHAEIRAYEPVECLAKKIIAHGLGVQVFNLACTDFDGADDLTVTDFPESSSLLVPIKRSDYFAPHLQPVGSCRAHCVRLDSHVERDAWHKVDLIKIDVQGSELSVLRGLGGILMQPCHVLIEVIYEPFYEGQADPHDIDHFLTAQGYVLVDEFPGGFHGLWADRLYERTTDARCNN